MIDRAHRLPIARQAQLLGMSRGAVYYCARPTSAADLALMRRIDELHLEHPFMGVRMLRRQLARGRARGPAPHRHAHAAHGHRGPGAAARHQQAPARPQDLPLSAAQAGRW